MTVGRCALLILQLLSFLFALFYVFLFDTEFMFRFLNMLNHHGVPLILTSNDFRHAVFIVEFVDRQSDNFSNLGSKSLELSLVPIECRITGQLKG